MRQQNILFAIDATDFFALHSVLFEACQKNHDVTLAVRIKQIIHAAIASTALTKTPLERSRFLTNIMTAISTTTTITATTAARGHVVV